MANEFDQFDENDFDQFDEPRSIGQKIAGTAEGVASLFTSIIAQPVSGVVGAAVAPLRGVDTAVQAIEGTQRALTNDPESPEAQAIVRGAGGMSDFIAKIFRAPFAFGAGVGTRAAGGTIEDVADVGLRVMEEGVGATAGSAVAEATGSPLLGAATETIPAAIASVVGFKGAQAGIPKGPKITVPNERTGADIATDIRKGADISGDLLPNAEIIEAARRLGVDLNAEHYSSNVQFQEVARALKSRPGTKLEANERRALELLSEKADKLVDDLGGSADKSAVSQSILDDFTGSINQMELQAESLYSKVDAAIPKATRIEPDNVRTYLAEKIEDLGGDVSLLNAAEKQLVALTRDGGTPTYAALDRVRRNVGDGFSKRSGPFKDDSSGTLRQVYGALSEDQQSVAQAFGVGDVYQSARSIVAKRKAIEDQAVSLFGREINGSLVTKLRTASAALVRGDLSRFNKLIESLPEARRAEMAATLLDDLFSSGSRRGGQLSTGFVPAFQGLNRNKAAKDAIFKYLPESSRQRFDDIGTVLTGIVESNKRPMSNPSGSAAPIVAALEDGTMLQKMYRFGRDVTIAEGASSTMGFPGAGATGVAVRAASRGKASGVEAADRFLTSPKFRKAIDKALDGGVLEANAIAMDSPSFRNWLGQFDAQTQQRILNTGVVTWLVMDDE